MNFYFIGVLFGITYPTWTTKYENFVIFLINLVKYTFFYGLTYIYIKVDLRINGEIGYFMQKSYHFCMAFSAFVLFYYSWRFANQENRFFSMEDPPKLKIWGLLLFLLSVLLLLTAIRFENEERLPHMLLPDLIIKITCARFVMVVEFITKKFKVLNKKIKSQMMSHEEFKAFIYECKYFIVDHNRKDDEFDAKIVKFMKEHNEITALVPLVNEMYSTRMLFILITFFVSIMYFTYVFFIEIETLQRFGIIFGELIIYFF